MHYLYHYLFIIFLYNDLINLYNFCLIIIFIFKHLIQFIIYLLFQKLIINFINNIILIFIYLRYQIKQLLICLSLNYYTILIMIY